MLGRWSTEHLVRLIPRVFFERRPGATQRGWLERRAHRYSLIIPLRPARGKLSEYPQVWDGQTLGPYCSASGHPGRSPNVHAPGARVPGCLVAGRN
jgi:hypothetical protein